MWYVLKHVWSNFLNFSLFMWFWIFTHTQTKKKKKKRSNAKTIKTMHIKRCMMHKCMTMNIVYYCVLGDSCSYDSRAPQFLELGVSELCSTVPNSHVKSKVCFRVLSQNSQKGRMVNLWMQIRGVREKKINYFPITLGKNPTSPRINIVKNWFHDLKTKCGGDGYIPL